MGMGMVMVVGTVVLMVMVMVVVMIVMVVAMVMVVMRMKIMMLSLLCPSSHRPLPCHQILGYFDIVFTSVFTVEIVLKVSEGCEADSLGEGHLQARDQTRHGSCLHRLCSPGAGLQGGGKSKEVVESSRERVTGPRRPDGLSS